MALSKSIRKCLHAYGIHSATIQPEFCLNESHDHIETGEQQFPIGGGVDGPASVKKCAAQDMCLLECIDDCAEQGCCSTTTTAISDSGSHSIHSHDHDHTHDHDEEGHHH